MRGYSSMVKTTFVLVFERYELRCLPYGIWEDIPAW